MPPSRKFALSFVQPWLLFAICGLFVLAGLALLPHLGLQNDEALFAHSIYEPRAGVYFLPLEKPRIPLMLMSYLGTLKGWIYRQIFRAVRPNLYSIRVPVLLLGAWTVYMFYQLLRRIGGVRIAIFGTVLLAADASFLLTTVFDWGPVALQHLLYTAGVLHIVKWYQERRERSLFYAFLLFGLGMWDKALMAWMLGGAGIAALVVFPFHIWRALSVRRIGIAVAGFAIGALPLLIYNINNEWDTFRGNTQFDFTDIPNKAHLLNMTLTGEGLFGWMTAEDFQVPQARAPRNLLESVAAAVGNLAGKPRRGLMVAALVIAALLAPFARGPALRAILFSAIAATLAWFQMAITRNAGGSVHHAVLIWPLPQLFVAASFTAAAQRLGRYARPALGIALLALAIPGTLVINTYYVQAFRVGGALNWNDAIVPLAVALRDIPASNVFCTDWGILDSVRLLNRGRTPVRVGSDPISKPQLNEEDLKHVHEWLEIPDHLFVAHTAGNEFFEGTNAKLVKLATGWGYRQEMIRVIPDSFGRNIFEIYRFIPPQPPKP